MSLPPTTTTRWADQWQRSWDQLEESLIPDRELRITTLLDILDATTHKPVTILDLACGTGTITRRLRSRSPTTRAIALDVDPVLLTIAEATFADDPRVDIIHADLRDPSWTQSLPNSPIDAVLTSTALHWLPEEVVRRLYHDLVYLLPPGGLFAHAELMPLIHLPRLNAALTDLTRERRHRQQPTTPDWNAWWDTAASDPALADAIRRRKEIFQSAYPTEEFSPPADWHIHALTDAGFTEAGVVWRHGTGAIIAAIL